MSDVLTDEQLQEKVFKAHSEWFSHVGNSNFDFFDEVLAEDVILINNEAQVYNKQDFYVRIGNVDTHDQRAWDLKGERHGDTYLATGHYFLHATITVDGISEYHLYSNRFVGVWKLENGEWRVWHFQVTENPTVPHAARAYA